MSVWRALLSRFASGFAPSYTDFYDLAYDIQHPAGDTAHQGYNITDVGQLNFYAGGGIGQDSWAAPTLGASWVNFGSGYTSAGYRMDKQGRVWVRGLIKSGTTTDATVLFTLPSGYRPAGNILRTLGCNAGGNPYVVIGTDGTIKIYSVTGNTWLSIEGISFSTD